MTTKESVLEELRDLSVEIAEGDDIEGDERNRALVKVLAGTVHEQGKLKRLWKP